jgi:hypothetical protein
MRLRWKLRTMLLVLPAVGILAIVLPAMDSLGHGPYSTWYNRRCQQLADAAKLVGRPEADVIKVLGPPLYTYLDTTYNYAPVSWLPTAKFQVHCEDGVVVAVEQFDD